MYFLYFIFVATNGLQDVFLYGQKPLATNKVELTQLFFFMVKSNNKNNRLYIRLSDDENRRLRDLAQGYPSLSAFVLDACWHFNGTRHLKRVEYLEEKFKLLQSMRSELNRVAANLNQLVQYTNSCIKMGVYLPNTASEIQNIQSTLQDCLVDYRIRYRNLEKELSSIIKKI